MRTHTELAQLTTFEERFRYLSIRGRVGEATFGYERTINQRFYTSTEWYHIRKFVIARDNNCDLGVEGYEIHERTIIHHMNPMTPEDIYDRNMDILDPEYLITVTHRTHNAIHYGDESQLRQPLVERQPGDTKLW
jgi:hypothetical protein